MCPVLLLQASSRRPSPSGPMMSSAYLYKLPFDFTTNMTIVNRDYVVIMLPGFTSGNCDGMYGCSPRVIHSCQLSPAS